MPAQFIKLTPEVAERIYNRHFYQGRHGYCLEPWMMARPRTEPERAVEAAPPSRQHTIPKLCDCCGEWHSEESGCPGLKPITLQTDEGWLYLKEGDVLQLGDEYGMPHFRFVIGTNKTGLKDGDAVPAQIMCYKPRRWKPQPPAYTPVVCSCHPASDHTNENCPMHGQLY